MRPACRRGTSTFACVSIGRRTLWSPGYAAAFVAGKIRNSRTLIRRHGGADAANAVEQLAGLARSATAERDLASLLGIEGVAARIYFERFAALLRDGAELTQTDFSGRNRRPHATP